MRPRARCASLSMAWIAKVGPASAMPRLPERDYCSLAGVLAAALALSELFPCLRRHQHRGNAPHGGTFAVAAGFGYRVILAALGIPVEYLPRELWVLGLGHLGNAYLWSLASLPYPKPGRSRIRPLRFRQGRAGECRDRHHLHRGRRTPSQDARRLRLAGTARLPNAPGRAAVRRHAFAATTKNRGWPCAASTPIPRAAISARRNSVRVVESGLGGTASNFDTISLHTLPNPRTPAELWPDLSEEEEKKRAEHQEPDRARKSGLYAPRQRRVRPIRARRQIGRRAVRGRGGGHPRDGRSSPAGCMDGQAYIGHQAQPRNAEQALGSHERKLCGPRCGGIDLRQGQRLSESAELKGKTDEQQGPVYRAPFSG